MENMKTEAVKQAWFSVPSIWASTLTLFFGITLNEWVGVTSIIYCTSQFLYLIWKWRRELKAKE
jgi:hypothetical protein